MNAPLLHHKVSTHQTEHGGTSGCIWERMVCIPTHLTLSCQTTYIYIYVATSVTNFGATVSNSLPNVTTVKYGAHNNKINVRRI